MPEACVPKARIRKMTSPKLIQIALLVAILCSLTACSDALPDEPTPDAAKQFLQLRGYQFDEKSFFKAAENRDVMAINGFIAAGMKPDVKDENGDTALTLAADRGDAAVAEALLKHGADVNAKGRNGWTALLLALHENRWDVGDVLLSQPNVDLKAETPEGTSALMLAVWRERAETVRKLLQRGADANQQDKEGDASLHGAAWFGNTTILGLLLDAGANPNVKNKLGGTPLMWAAAYGQDAAVQMLLARGANPSIKDVDGVTAAGWAAKNGRGSLEMILRQAEKQKAVGTKQ